MRNLVIGLALFGCSVSESPTAERVEMVQSPIGLYEQDCSEAYSPTEKAYPFVKDATERWSKATECDIHVGIGGIHVDVANVLYHPEHPTKPINGETRMDGCDTLFIMISLASPHPYATTAHEIGHDLSRKCWGDDMIHSESGVMAAPIVTDDIDAASLNLICSGLNCRGYNLSTQ